MPEEDFISIIVDQQNKVVGAIYAKRYDAKATELQQQWKAFLIWRKEAEKRTILTSKERKALSSNIAEAFMEFLYMQNGNWSCTCYRDTHKSILKIK